MIASGFINAAGDLCAHGLKVCPLIEGRKIPLTDHGCLDATDDEHILAEWHDRWPNANIGVATGAGSGVCVLDVDVKDGAGGYETMVQLAATGRTLPDCPTSITPSGGKHFWFTYQPGLKNIAGKTKAGRGFGPGVDFRTTGGYVVAPPSRLIAREDHGAGEYRWIVPLETAFPPLPDWAASMLRDEWRPRPKYRPIQTDDVTLAKLEPLARTVATTAEGRRNAVLYWAACAAAKDGVPTANIERELAAAALTAGLETDKSAATIRSALNRIRGENP